MDLVHEGKKTDDIRKELTEAPDLNEYLSENQAYFSSESVQELLNELYRKTDLTKAELARRSGVSSVYLHQLFAGKRNPSRDRLLCLAIGLGATFEDTQRLLRQSGFAELYARDKRDAVILYGITHHQKLQEVNDALFDQGENTLI